MNSGARMLLQYRGLGGRISWDEGPLGARASRPHNDGFLGARASRPHKSWHSLGHFHDLDQPGTAPWLDAVPSNRVEHRIEAQRRPSGERCRLPGSSMAKFARSAKNRRGSMPQQEQGAGGTPALPGDHSPLRGKSQKLSRKGKADAVGGGRRAARPGNRFFYS